MKKKTGNIRQLDAIGKETLLALLTHKTRTAAAKALSVNRDTIYERVKRYDLDTFIDAIPESALQTLKIGSERAAGVFVEELDSRKNKMEAAREILDRVGVGTKGEQGSTYIQDNREQNLYVIRTTKTREEFDNATSKPKRDL